MELRQLRTFATAAELASFTRTAERMDISQPAVSQQIAALEYELGVSLFNRGGRSIELTDSGRHFYEYARQALDLLDEGTREIGGQPVVVTGAVNIATCTVAPESLLPELIAGFQQENPQVRVLVNVSDATDATQSVVSGAADVGFVVVQPKGTGLHAQAILCQELALVVAPTHHFAEAGKVTAEDLLKEKFVLREPGSGTRLCLEQALLESGISPSVLAIALETNSNDAVRGAVRQNTGIAFLADPVVYVRDFPVLHVEAPSGKASALTDDHAFAAAWGNFDIGRNCVRTILNVDESVLHHPGHALIECQRPAIAHQVGTTGYGGVESLVGTIIQSHFKLFN